MECEICGRQAGRGKKIELDGSTLIVCEECAKFGVEKEEERPRQSFGPRISGIPIVEKEFDLGLGIAPDFGKRVREARERKGLTVKELAMKIFEKESLLHRIENQAIKPSDSIIQKLERELGIELKSETG